MDRISGFMKRGKDRITDFGKKAGASVLGFIKQHPYLTASIPIIGYAGKTAFDFYNTYNKMGDMFSGKGYSMYDYDE